MYVFSYQYVYIQRPVFGQDGGLPIDTLFVSIFVTNSSTTCNVGTS